MTGWIRQKQKQELQKIAEVLGIRIPKTKHSSAMKHNGKLPHLPLLAGSDDK